MSGNTPASISDLRSAARGRVPRLFFDYCDGGAGEEAALHRNMSRLSDIRMLPRGPRDVSSRQSGVRLFGKDYAQPFGISPIGLANLFWPGTDIALARAARQAGIPHVLSTAASTMLEEVAPETGGMGWFQLYVSKDDAITDDLLRRAEAAGYEVLVVTVDITQPGKRRKDIRNGFTLPMPMGPRFMAQLAARPSWCLAAFGKPVPKIVNLERYAPSDGAQTLAAFMAAQISAAVDLDQIARIRARWKGAMVVKGILHPDDAVALADAGVDGVIVSNHGGRQLDSAPATIDALPAIAAAAGDRLTIMLDGGIRCGEDMAKALAAGARFVFSARAFLYSVAATGGDASVGVSMLADEFDRVLAHLGCTRPEQLSPDLIWPGDLSMTHGKA